MAGGGRGPSGPVDHFLSGCEVVETLVGEQGGANMAASLDSFRNEGGNNASGVGYIKGARKIAAR